MLKQFSFAELNLPKYLFFTGKGGVGKTSSACAVALHLADNGKKVFLVSTDPASNLQDVFATELTSAGVVIAGAPNLVVANFDPVDAAEQYKESVVGPYRGKLPAAVIHNMEEQLSGSCTVEIAAFNQFAECMTDDAKQSTYDHIIFDTAPTGHTLRLLQLPSAWSNFISESTHGASCLGQLSGLESKKQIYKAAVSALADAKQTLVILVARPELSPLKEAERASRELATLNIDNQLLLINGVLDVHDDQLSEAIFKKQQTALANIPDYLTKFPSYTIPYRPYNITGLNNVRGLLTVVDLTDEITLEAKLPSLQHLNRLIDDLSASNKRVIFTMGKGGVGKTTVAAAIALGLRQRGKKVHLTTTDPAAHLHYVIDETSGISVSHIDEHQVLAAYKEKVLAKARESMADDDLAYIEEDLRSPCTQEIAVFNAFAEIVERSQDEIVIIDTAPTGHTLLLLDATQSYHKEVARSQGEIPAAVEKLLPHLRDPQYTDVVIVTLAEMTPVHEASRLAEDLDRAGILHKWWVINSSLAATNTTNKLLKARAQNEVRWINKVAEISQNNFAVIKWHPEEIKGATLSNLFTE